MRSVISALQRYIELMLERVRGMKVLIMDAETTGVISMIYSQSQILEKEVFLVERIESDPKEKMRHLNAVCLLRPTDKNFMLLSKAIKNPKYKEYHIFFTNCVPHHRLEQLACCDELEVVHQVQEIFADIFAVTHDLFSLNQSSNIWMSVRNPIQWTAYEESIFQRHVEGLLSVILATQGQEGGQPLVRYAHGSDISQKLAGDLVNRMNEEHSLFGPRGNSPSSSPTRRTLIIVDRKDDPVTPLLNQWTYHAMIHELLGIENNRVDLRKAPGVSSDQKEVAMSVLHDPFLEENLYSNFGDFGANIKSYVEMYQEKTKTNAKIDTIEDMQRFVDDYPEFRKLSGNVSKHVSVVHELSRIVQASGLLSLSRVEQEVACSEARNEHHSQVLQNVKRRDINNMERLRLVLLFALRYENERSSIETLKAELRANGIDDDQVALVDLLLRYAGNSVRGGDLFGNKSFWNATAKKMTNTFNFKGIENVYTQHTSLLKATVDNMIKGKLREADFPYAANSIGGSAKEKSSNILVFIVGGCTFEEARDMADLKKENKNVEITLGGSCMHSSKSFLADVAQLARAQNY